MSNLRAYRDGDRLVLVVENPTRELEELVAGIISGQIISVKDLSSHAEMKPFEVKDKGTGGISEVSADAAPHMDAKANTDEAGCDESPRQAMFVKKLKSEQEKSENAPKESNSASDPVKTEELKEDAAVNQSTEDKASQKPASGTANAAKSEPRQRMVSRAAVVSFLKEYLGTDAMNKHLLAKYKTTQVDLNTLSNDDLANLYVLIHRSAR